MQVLPSTLVVYCARATLLILGLAMSYIALDTQYNLAHWMPRTTFEYFGMSYDTQLWLEQHTDVLLHFFGAMLLYLLLILAQLLPPTALAWPELTLISFLCLLTELVQHGLGQVFSVTDLIWGLAGVTLAWLSWLGWQKWHGFQLN